ncbi:PRD domain-containing protein [Vagococcus zengguangii]|uniref:PRD domain-containing protein n=1 Tax=Vagococcus zengguangii TaxID=2571750 RepID=A0A4D7D066_9ENTE|nr:PRD domain-containing protein [Vagococcus zengguangii]TLG78332.1 PRD domain-containing protein [Vagococcus zengguangii]
MKRSDKIYKFVLEHTSHLNLNDLDNNRGVTASDIEKKLNIQRANASRDLNQLVREGLVLKGKGRPVCYIANLSIDSVEPLIEKKEVNSAPIEKLDVFDNLIGGTHSLKLPIEQAKAAILYPPNGLNCLITGATGSGKSFFAKAMFEYAKENNVLAEDKKLVVFNCADYAHNSELLMSHLFGYVEGAFTGANKNKAGLIQEADNSMLFLDEIHRLPPEGQEMIFYFMDHGLYNRLGETLKNQKANVRIICATTEDPSSALLNTFVRRIPINIKLPSFEERTPREKVDLAVQMFAIEAQRIGKNISLTSDVMKALIGSVTFGNVGQLKSNVQLICARSFLTHVEDDELAIDLEQLPLEIKRGLSEIANNRQLAAELTQLLSANMIISPNNEVKNSSLVDTYDLPYDLYEVIGEKTKMLQGAGVNQEKIKEMIMSEINMHLSSFYKNHGLMPESSHHLVELVDPELVELTKEIHQIASTELEYPFQINFIYALSLHISAYLRRAAGEQAGETLESNAGIRELVTKHPKEYQVALKIKELIANKYQVLLPADEIDYLTLLIVSLKENYHGGKIGIIVAAHGDATASSMVQVAKQLFGNHNITAVDMPLDMAPKVAYQKIIEAANTIQYSSGLILLVDMGSLLTFGEEIAQELNVDVRTLDMVTTSLVLETARKTDLLDADLESLYQALLRFNGYGQRPTDIKANTVQTVQERNEPSEKAIVAICASGKGAAERMKSLILENLEDIETQHLSVIPISVLNMKERIKEIQKDYQLLAVTGIVDPRINVPFYSLDSLLTGKAIHSIRELLVNDTLITDNQPMSMEQTQQLCLDYLSDYYTFINPHKVLPIFWEFTETVFEKVLRKPVTEYLSFVNVVSHLAGMLEREIRHEPISVDAGLLTEAKETKLYQIIEFEKKEIEQSFNITISQEEVFYIFENIKNTLDLSV